MITELKKQEKEIQEKIKAWEDYETSNNKYYNIPLPNEIENSYIAETTVYEHTIDECKEKLNFLKIVSDYYDNHDFIVDFDHIMYYNYADSIKDMQITPIVREKLNKIIYNLEKDIQKVEKSIKN